MFKRFVSCLIIVSILWVDVVAAMDSGGRPPSEEGSSRSTAKKRSTSESPPKDDSSTRALTDDSRSPPREGSEKEPLLKPKDRALVPSVASRALLGGSADSLPSFPSPKGSIQEACSPLEDDWESVEALRAPEARPGVLSKFWSCLSGLGRCFRRTPVVDGVDDAERDIGGHSRASEEEAAAPVELSARDRAIDVFFRDDEEPAVVPSVLGHAAGNIQDVEQGLSPKPSPLQPLHKMFQDLLQRDPGLARAFFDDWLRENEDFLETPCWDVCLQLEKAHPEFFEKDFLRGLDSNALTGLTLRRWLANYGLGDPGTPATGPEKALCYHLRKAVKATIASRMFDDQMQKNRPLKAFLEHFDKVTLKRTFTCAQWALGFFGLAVAAGNAIAQGTIFYYGLDAFFYKIGWGDNYEGQTPFGLSVAYTTMVIAFFESLPRDLLWFTALGNPSEHAFIKRKEDKGFALNALVTLRHYIAALPAMALSVWYLFDPEYQGVLNAKDEGLDPTPYWTYFGCLAGPLALEALALTVKRVRETEENLGHRHGHFKEWLASTWVGRTRFAPFLVPHALSPHEQAAEDFIEHLNRAKRAIFTMEPKEVEDLYHRVHANFSSEGRGTDLEGSLALRVLLEASTHGKDIALPHSPEGEEETASPAPHQSWGEKHAVKTSIGVTLLASPGRYAAYYTVMGGFLEAFGCEGKIRKVLAHSLGFISSVIQGSSEQTAIEENMKGVGFKPPHAYSSHPWAQKALKRASMAVGVYFVLPYLVLGWTALEKWPVEALVPFLLFFGTGDGHSSYWDVKEAYKIYPHACDWAKEKICGGKSNPEYRRDQLMTDLDDLTKLAKRADPRVIEDANKLIVNIPQ